MATTTPARRTFEIALSPDDGLVRIRSAETGRVTLAISIEEATQLRAGLKGALRSNEKQTKKRSKKSRSSS